MTHTFLQSWPILPGPNPKVYPVLPLGSSFGFRWGPSEPYDVAICPGDLARPAWQVGLTLGGAWALT